MSVAITPGVGASVAADRVGSASAPGAGDLIQYVKVDVGAAGASSPLVPGQAAMAGSLPVVLASNQSALPVTGTFWQATQPVSAASLPLPTGAATDATLAAMSAKYPADKAAFTEGTTAVHVAAGEYNDSATSPSSGQAAAVRITAARGLHANLRDSAGAELGTSGNPVVVISSIPDGFNLTQGTSTDSAWDGVVGPTSVVALMRSCAASLKVAPTLSGNALISAGVGAPTDAIASGAANGSAVSLLKYLRSFYVDAWDATNHALKTERVDQSDDINDSISTHRIALLMNLSRAVTTSGATSSGLAFTRIKGSDGSTMDPAVLTEKDSNVFDAQAVTLCIFNPSASGQTINAASLVFTDTGNTANAITYALPSVSIAAGAKQNFYVPLTSGFFLTPSLSVTYAVNPSASTLTATAIFGSAVSAAATQTTGHGTAAAALRVELPTDGNGQVNVASDVVAAVITGAKSSIGTSAVQMTSTSLPATKGVLVKAAAGNSGTVYVGPSGVTANSSDSTDGIPLAAGESVTVPVANANLIYCFGSASSQKVFFMVA